MLLTVLENTFYHQRLALEVKYYVQEEKKGYVKVFTKSYKTRFLLKPTQSYFPTQMDQHIVSEKKEVFFPFPPDQLLDHLKTLQFPESNPTLSQNTISWFSLEILTLYDFKLCCIFCYCIRMKKNKKKLYLMFTFTKLTDCQPITLTLKLNFPDVHARLIFEVSS